MGGKKILNCDKNKLILKDEMNRSVATYRD